ncbi:MAG: helix-turn-helix transcriptional regulator [Clostridia bacterium]|nr:helix-turn-helix transcriptional regulator [Clostridia bacterium]
MELNLREIGKRIQDERIKLGYTQIQFAEILHMSVSQMARLEGGTRTPSLQVLTDIVVLTETSADYLLYGDDRRNSVKREMQKIIASMCLLERRI